MQREHAGCVLPFARERGLGVFLCVQFHLAHEGKCKPLGAATTVAILRDRRGDSGNKKRSHCAILGAADKRSPRRRYVTVGHMPAGECTS